MPTDWRERRDAFAAYIQSRNLSRATLETRLDAVDCFCHWLLAQTDIRDLLAVETQTLREFQGWMQEGQGWKAATVQTRLGGLRAFFGFLETHGHLLFNPCEGLLLPRQEHRLPGNVLSHAQVETLLAAPDLDTPKGLRDRAIMEVFYSTGIRRAEMVALTVRDVDCQGGFVQVRAGKGCKDRVVPLGASAAQCLDRYIREVWMAWVRGQPSVARLWLSSIIPHDRPLSRNAMDKVIQGYGLRTSIEVSCHTWRHTCATHLLQGGATIAHVQQLLGHADIANTQIYTRVTEPELCATHRKSHPRRKSQRQPTQWKPAAGPNFKGAYTAAMKHG